MTASKQGHAGPSLLALAISRPSFPSHTKHKEKWLRLRQQSTHHRAGVARPAATREAAAVRLLFPLALVTCDGR